MATDHSSDSHVLAAAIRGIRRLRALSSSETAAGMNLTLRTYQDFEAGKGRINIEYIHRFCSFVDADPDAIFAAIAIGSPEFAVRCAANKLMRMVMIGIKQLDRQLGDKLVTLEARSIVAVVDASVKDLVDRASGKEAADWLKAGEEDLRRSRPNPGR